LRRASEGIGHHPPLGVLDDGDEDPVDERPADASPGSAAAGAARLLARDQLMHYPTRRPTRFEPRLPAA
jgi:hypothetical protein